MEPFQKESSGRHAVPGRFELMNMLSTSRCHCLFRISRVLFKPRERLFQGFCLTILLTALISSPAAAQESLDLSVKEANRLWWNGEYERAVRLYRESVRSNEGTTDAVLELAALYRSMSDYRAAIRLYRSLLAERGIASLSDPVSRVLVPLGESCYYVHRLEVAEEAFRQAIALEPQNATALFGLGRVLVALGGLDEAASLLRKSAELDPAFSGSYIYLARIAEKQENPERAVALYRKALQIDSQHAELLFPLGRAFLTLESWENAFRQYHRLRNLDEHNPLVLARLAEVRPKLSRPEEEVVPQRALDTFKEVPARAVSADMPMMRIGLNTDVPGMKNLSFMTNGPFVIHAEHISGEKGPRGTPLFEGLPHREYRVFVERGKPFIVSKEQEGNDTAQELTHTFTIEVLETGGTDGHAAGIIVRSIEYARGYAWAGIEDRQYRGRMEVHAGAAGLRLVNVIGLEEYLYGVLPSEMSISFPEEALKAQAVIARSYALYRKRVVRPHRNDGYDLCDSQHCQVYRGASNEWSRTTAAVDATRGEVLMSGGRLASPLFHANCGGHTQSSSDLKGWGEVPYLTGVLDGPPELPFPSSPVTLERWLKSTPPSYCGASPYNGGPEFRWFRLIPVDLLQEKLDRLRGVGGIREVTVLRRTSAGYAHSLRIAGTRSTIIIEREHEMRRLLGLGPLRSNLFWIETKYDSDGNPEEFLLYGGGWGHGVGLCQDGAGGMAAQGFSYRNILAHYYFNTDLVRLGYE